MREIILKTISAGPSGIMHKGRHRVPKGEAAVLVGEGHAEYADGLLPETATVVPVEIRAQRGRSKK